MEYRELGNIPISESSAVGSNVRYDETFELLQAEIDKLSSPNARDTFKWETVEKNAALILKEKSKDLLVASYLGVALVNEQGATGLDIATQIIKDLLATYWDNMFPPAKRLRGRIAALEWWIDKSSTFIESANSGEIAEDLQKAILERFSQIDELLDQHLGDKVFLRPLIRATETFFERATPVASAPVTSTPEKEKRKDNTPAPAPVAPAAPVTSPSSGTNVDLSAPSVDLDSADQVHKQLKPIFQKIAQGAKILREKSITDPQSYNWLRFATYEWVKTVPPVTGDEGKTSLAGPPQQLVRRLKSLHQTGSWEELLHSSETALMNAQNIFWMDLNWYTGIALQSLNGCAAAREEIAKSTLYVLNRLEGVEDLRFATDLPFASDDAKEWFQELRDQASGGSSLDVEQGPGAASHSLNEAFEQIVFEAHSIAKDAKRIGKALRLLEKQITSCVSEKDALELRLVMLELILKAKHTEPAAALAELILNDVERFHLMEWDVPLAIRCHLLVYDVFKKASNLGYKEKKRIVYQRILSMSAADALSL